MRNEVNGPELVYHKILIKSGNKVQSLLALGEGNLFGGHSQVTISRSFFLELVKIILEIVNLDSVLLSPVIQDLKRKERVSFTNSNKIVTGRIQKSQKSPSFFSPLHIKSGQFLNVSQLVTAFGKARRTGVLWEGSRMACPSPLQGYPYLESGAPFIWRKSLHSPRG